MQWGAGVGWYQPWRASCKSVYRPHILSDVTLVARIQAVVAMDIPGNANATNTANGHLQRELAVQLYQHTTESIHENLHLSREYSFSHILREHFEKIIMCLTQSLNRF